jgi:hypothetical protein
MCSIKCAASHASSIPCSSSVPCLVSSSSFPTAHLPWKPVAPPRHMLDSLRSPTWCRSRTTVVSRSPSTSPSCTPPHSSAKVAAATLPSTPHSPHSTKMPPRSSTSRSYTLVVAARCSSTRSPFAFPSVHSPNSSLSFPCTYACRAASTRTIFVFVPSNA